MEVTQLSTGLLSKVPNLEFTMDQLALAYLRLELNAKK